MTRHLWVIKGQRGTCREGQQYASYEFAELCSGYDPSLRGRGERLKTWCEAMLIAATMPVLETLCDHPKFSCSDSLVLSQTRETVNIDCMLPGPQVHPTFGRTRTMHRFASYYLGFSGVQSMTL